MGQNARAMLDTNFTRRHSLANDKIFRRSRRIARAASGSTHIVEKFLELAGA